MATVNPEPIDLVRELREALGMFAGAMPITPKEAWEEAMTEVRKLRQQPTMCPLHDLPIGQTRRCAKCAAIRGSW